MGIRTALRLIQGSSALDYAQAPTVKRMKPSSPWSEGGLAQVIAADWFGTDGLAVTRTEAMTVPAVANARWLICNPLSRQPLTCWRGEGKITTPAWLYRTNGQTPPQIRMMNTLDDLLFAGYSLWAVERSAAGTITDAVRVSLERWGFTADWEIEVDGELVNADEVILFTSPMDPLLVIGARTIRAARNIEDSWAARVRDPIPVMEIRQTEDIELDDENLDDPDYISEGQEIVNAYLAARKSSTGSVVFVPYGYELQPHGETTPELYIEGRNAVAIDIGRFTALDPSLLGASQVAASLTYSTKQGARSDYQDISQSGWAMAIEARLSMDDVTPRGTSVRFDLSNLNTTTMPATGPTMED